MLAKFDDIDRYVSATLLTIRGQSKRVYEQTYNLWKDWSHNNGVSPLDLLPQNVIAFLSSQHVTRATRRGQLSAMRMLLRVMVAMTERTEIKFAYDMLKLAKIPTDNLADTERNLKALNPDEANRLLSVWSDDNPIHLRNRALIALLLSTGLRRAEAVALEWRDVHIHSGLIGVRHGKGDKDRVVAIVGDYAVQYLEAWWNVAPFSRYVFRPLDNQGGLLDDRPIGVDNLYRIVKQTEKLSGVKFSPHDTRRSLATELLAEGAPLADVQAQLGHAHPSTTLRYAKPADAAERRKRFRTRYGD